jgi:hypothetical protein
MSFSSFVGHCHHIDNLDNAVLHRSQAGLAAWHMGVTHPEEQPKNRVRD